MNSVFESRTFKPVKDGYIFRLLKGKAYRVTEAQKAQILAAMEPARVRWLRWATHGTLALGVASGVTVGQAAGESLWHSFLVSASVFLVAQIIGTSMVYRAVSRRLQPLLAGLPHSDE